MNNSYKKFSKCTKSLNHYNTQNKMQDKLFSKKELEIKNFFPIERNPQNNFGHIYFQTQNFFDFPIEPYNTIDTYYSNYHNFNRIRPLSKDPIIPENPKKYLSYSKNKNYFSPKIPYIKTFTYKPKTLFGKSDIYNNGYNLNNNNYLNYNDNNNLYYNNYNSNENIRNRNFFNYSINLDNISNLKINNNYDYPNNTTFFNTINNDKMKSSSNNYIINTNINYNYINNSINFNTINNDFNNKYHINLNSVDGFNDDKLNMNITGYQYLYTPNTNIYINYDEDNYRNTQYYSHKNIKNNRIYHSESKDQIKSESKLDFLKDENELCHSYLNDNYKYSKSQNKNISNNKLKLGNEGAKKNKNNKKPEKSSSKKINKISKTRERKNKIRIDSNSSNKIKNKNIKTIFSNKSRTNNNSQDYTFKENINNNNNFYIVKNTRKNNFSLIKKDNPHFRNKYLLKNIDSFSTNNHNQKDISSIKKIKTKTISIPFNKKNNKSMVNSTNLKILEYKQKSKKSEKKEEKNQRIMDKFKMLNTNRILTRDSIKIKTSLNNNINIKNKKINILINKKPKTQKIETNRKHKITLLSKLVKKECEICHKMIDSHLFKIHFNSHPTQILDWLFLGTFANACDIEELRRNKINYVLNCAMECNNRKLPPDIEERHLNIRDVENFDIIEYFEEANDFINKCRLNGGNILIHCKFGISRSPSFVIHYLNRYNKLTVDEALELVSKKRSQIKPNKGFMNQLYLFEKIFWKR